MSDHDPATQAAEEEHVFDDPRNVKRVIRALFTVCALLLAVDLLDPFGVLYHKHVHFDFERFPGFFFAFVHRGVYRVTGPQGVFARTWSTGSIALSAALMLGGYLLFYFFY